MFVFLDRYTYCISVQLALGKIVMAGGYLYKNDHTLFL